MLLSMQKTQIQNISWWHTENSEIRVGWQCEYRYISFVLYFWNWLYKGLPYLIRFNACRWCFVRFGICFCSKSKFVFGWLGCTVFKCFTHTRGVADSSLLAKSNKCCPYKSIWLSHQLVIVIFYLRNSQPDSSGVVPILAVPELSLLAGLGSASPPPTIGLIIGHSSKNQYKNIEF